MGFPTGKEWWLVRSSSTASLMQGIPCTRNGSLSGCKHDCRNCYRANKQPGSQCLQQRGSFPGRQTERSRQQVGSLVFFSSQVVSKHRRAEEVRKEAAANIIFKKCIIRCNMKLFSRCEDQRRRLLSIAQISAGSGYS